MTLPNVPHHPGPEHGSPLSDTEIRVRALETLLTEKGYVERAALDAIIEAYETRIGPHAGARVVAKAWLDPQFMQALLHDATNAIATLGHVSQVGDHLVAVANTPTTHNLVVCTLCSCYPWEMLGLPPVWYKSAPYRSRAVKDPRGVLADFGVTLPHRHAHPRVGLHRRDPVPGRAAAPRGHRGLDRRAAGRHRQPRQHDRHRPGDPCGGSLTMDGIHDMGGMDGYGKVEPEANEPVFHEPWEGRVMAMNRAMGTTGTFTIDRARFFRESLPPPSMSGELLPEVVSGSAPDAAGPWADRCRRGAGGPLRCAPAWR
jgi:nitrile hydratase